MQAIYTGSPRDARELSRKLIEIGVDAVAFAAVTAENGGKPRRGRMFVVYVPDHDAAMVRRYLQLSGQFMARVRGTA